MNKKILSLMVVVLVSQSAQAAPESFVNRMSNGIAHFSCDTLKLLLPSYISESKEITSEVGEDGKPVLYVRETNKDLWDKKEVCERDEEGTPFKLVKNENLKTNERVVADDNVPADQKKEFVEILTNTRDQNVATARTKFHSELAKKIFGWKSYLIVERLHGGAWLAAAIYGAVKGVQKLQDIYAEEQRGINFDEFADEVTEKVSSK